MTSNVPSQRAQRGMRRYQGTMLSAKDKRGNRIENQWKRAFSDAGNDGQAQNPGEDDICLICAEELEFAAISPCNHYTCHKCTFRQRSLYGKRTCLVCRSEVPRAIFTQGKERTYDSFEETQLNDKNEEYGVVFTSPEVKTAVLGLLKYSCPFNDADGTDFGSYKNYNHHLKTAHNKTICSICAQYKKAFPCELKIFTPNLLRVHQSRGDTQGFWGHPMCRFCSGQRFYSEDELRVHLRDRHERCHICDQIDSTNPQYFKNYDQLFEHFKDAHYICTVQSCLDSKFVVFRDELDLQAHILKEHGSLTGSKRTATLANGRRYQSQLSTFEPPSSINSSATRAEVSTESTSSQETKKLRMEERARHYLNYSHSKFETFLSINDQFCKRNITAYDVLTSYEALFTSPEADIMLIIYDFSEMFNEKSANYKELREVYESEKKKRDRITNFPSLTSSASLMGANVISGSWGTQTGPTKIANKMNFPSLKKPSASPPPLRAENITNKPAAVKSKLPAVRTSTPSLSDRSRTGGWDARQGSTSRPNIATSLSGTSITKDKFPPLPKPDTKKFRAPPLHQPNIPDPSRWGKTTSVGVGSGPVSPSPSSSSDSLASNGKKKNKQKQLLFHIGI
ncbi:LAMI_0B03862g1_1 [Lachancea mirantina]|uniref:RING-type E3 ubiquitin transferase n=1 Tax=Lachancea mirantina TaxID=1230905 RepID=A0A1G4IV67_9SACH|nr:LAMI_0B03862g1_1 [Lachancea mirantina]